MFDEMVKGADKYVTKQGSTWLIFTEDKRWVVEFTKDKTLWFNYNMFQSELELIGKDSTEEIDLIKSWFESRFLNKPKVKHTNHLTIGDSWEVEDTIQNGVKLTNSSLQIDGSCVIEDVIQEGVKYTFSSTNTSLTNVEDTIQNGVKDIREVTFLNQMFIEETIQDGVKEMQPLPAQDGNRDWGLYYHRQEARTKPHTEYVKEVIEDSYNHRGRVEGIIKNTDKDGI
jgi:hypothetical protein